MEKLNWKRQSRVVLIGISFILSLGIALFAWTDMRSRDEEVLNTQSEIIGRLVQNEFSSILKGLQGVKGLFVAFDGKINRDQFRKYAESRDYFTNFPGAYGFGFIRLVPDSQLSAYIQHTKNVNPDFNFRNLPSNLKGPNRESFIIEMLEPVQGNKPAIGLNVGSEERRQAAAIESMMMGTSALTHSIKLVQGKRTEVGFLYYLPIYKTVTSPSTQAERVKQFYGWSYAPVVADRIMNSLISKLPNNLYIKIEDVLDNGEVEVLFESKSQVNSSGIRRLSTLRSVSFGGRTWRLTTIEAPIGWLSQKTLFPFSLFFLAFAIIFGTGRLLLAPVFKLKDSVDRDRQKIDDQMFALNQISIVAMTDARGLITYANDNFVKISGYSLDELIGKNHKILNSGYHSKEFFKNMWMTIRAGQLWSGEIRNKRKSGEYYWVETYIIPVLNGDQQVEKYISIRYDITQRKALEEKMANQISWNEGILNGATYLVISTDIHGTITTFNRAARKLLGYRSEEMVGIQTPGIIHDTSEVVERAHQLSKELGRPINPGFEVFIAVAAVKGFEIREWTYIRKDGSRFPVRLCVSALRDTSGKLIGFMGVAEDISEQKRLNAQILSQQAQMIQNAKMSTLGEMAAGIAHEVNNPLAIIKGKSTQLRRFLNDGDFEPQKLESALLTIENTVERIAKIIKGLRFFSRDSSHEAFVSANLNEIIKDTVTLCQEKITREKVNLKISLDSDFIFDCKPVQLSQVLLNLIANGVDAISGSEKPWIEIDAKISEQKVIIRITDSGHGIAPEIVERMMNPFFTTKEVGKGTGLGLSISKGIIEAHHGKLFYDNSSAHTAFVIQIPIRQNAQ